MMRTADTKLSIFFIMAPASIGCRTRRRGRHRDQNHAIPLVQILARYPLHVPRRDRVELAHPCIDQIGIVELDGEGAQQHCTRLRAADGVVVAKTGSVLGFLELPGSNRLTLDALQLFVDRGFYLFRLTPLTHSGRDTERSRADPLVDIPSDPSDELELLVEPLIET